MSAVTLSANSSVDLSTAMYAMQLSGKVAAENIDAGMPVCLKSDGKLYKYAAGQFFIGIAARTVRTGQALTVFGTGARFHVSDAGALTMGALYYVKDAGVIETAASASDTVGAFIAVSAKDLQVIRVGNLIDAT